VVDLKVPWVLGHLYLVPVTVTVGLGNAEVEVELCGLGTYCLPPVVDLGVRGYLSGTWVHTWILLPGED